jgi:LuxR family maltose regulon positive regulatory protein
MLRSLEQANLFIIPLDAARQWYRYHHLFSELLQHRLRLSGIAKDELHQRASQWYEAQGQIQDAIEHALAAPDWGNAARLIGVASESMFKRGESATLFRWCEQLPQEVITTSPDLCLTRAWAALMISRFDIAAPALEQAEQLAPPGSALMGQVASAQAFLARARRDNASAIKKSEQALALLPDSAVAVRGNIAMNLGLAYWHDGRIVEAAAVLAQASDLSQRSGNSVALLTAQVFLARILASQGKLHQAAVTCEKIIQATGQIPLVCLAHYDLTTIHLEWNDLAKAMEHFEKGFTLAQHSGNLEFIQAGHLLRGILALARGETTAALAALSEAEAQAREFPAVIRSRTAAFGVYLALARGDAQMLSDWELQVEAEVDFHSFYRFMGLTKARLLLARGKKDEAAEVLKVIYEAAARLDWGYGKIVVRILQSLAAKTSDEAIHFITDALRLGRADGYVRSFVDAGKGIIVILQEAVRRGVEPEYVSGLLAAMGITARVGTHRMDALVEPLSEREIEVLRLVAAGLSNREIAEKLVISPGTAKTHIHNLCGKMGASNRTEAAMKARELGLV